jgi:nuclear GTP-binding protein
VITQNALQTFQEEMAKVKKDPYKVIMKQTKLPITLLNETAKVGVSCLVQAPNNTTP